MKQVSELSDAELSGMFAVKVAGWTRKGKVAGDVFTYDKWHDEHGDCFDFDGGLIVPTFATSSDAVLPWLEKKEIYEVIYNNNPYTGSKGVSIQVSDAFTEDLKEPRGRSQWVNAPTFARAACIALLAAKGITEVEP